MPPQRIVLLKYFLLKSIGTLCDSKESKKDSNQEYGDKSTIGQRKLLHAPCKQPADVSQSIIEMFHPEKHPADHHKKEGQNNRNNPADSIIKAEEKGSLKYQKAAVVCAPYNKIPGCPMPETGSYKDKPEIHIGTTRRNAVSAQGNIKVIAHPFAECNVPTSPEFGNATGSIRTVEIFRQSETHHSPNADCHIRISAEVEINLESICQDADPCMHHRQLMIILRKIISACAPI